MMIRLLRPRTHPQSPVEFFRLRKLIGTFNEFVDLFVDKVDLWISGIFEKETMFPSINEIHYHIRRDALVVELKLRLEV